MIVEISQIIIEHFYYVYFQWELHFLYGNLV